MTKKRRTPIRIIRDSMVRGTQDHVKCDLRGSGRTSLGGAHIQEITQKVKEEAKDMEYGMLILQRVQNYLEWIISDATVREVTAAVQAVDGKSMSGGGWSS